MRGGRDLDGQGQAAQHPAQLCDLGVNLPDSTIYIDEFFSNPTCPGACQPNSARPFGGALTDVIVGGTGNFTGASGNLSGSVSVAGGGAVIQLSGTITLP